MSLAQSAERAALCKLIDYVDEDPEARIPKLMDMVDRYVPSDVFPAQRAAFSRAIESRNNWFQLIMKHHGPEPGGAATTWSRPSSSTANLMAWPEQEKMRDTHQLQHPLGHPARPHERLQPALHGLLGGGVRRTSSTSPFEEI